MPSLIYDYVTYASSNLTNSIKRTYLLHKRDYFLSHYFQHFVLVIKNKAKLKYDVIQLILHLYKYVMDVLTWMQHQLCDKKPNSNDIKDWHKSIFNTKM